MNARAAAALLFLGCAGGSTTPEPSGGGASSSGRPDNVATPQVIVAGAGDECGAVFDVGAYGDPDKGTASTPVPSGQLVTFTCSVRPLTSSTFAVAAALARGSDRLALDATFPTSGDANDVHVVVTRADGEWEGSSCTARYTDANMGVASGRAWAEVTCAQAKKKGDTATCALTAQVRFENCAQ